MKGKITFRSFLKGLRRLVFWISTLVAIILVLLIMALQLPVIQKYSADRVAEYLNKNTRQTLSLEGIKIRWFDQVEVEGILIKDYAGETMIEGKQISVDYNLNRLLADGNLWFDKVYLQDAALNLKKYPDSLGINLVEFINDLNALNTKPKDTTKVPPRLKVDEIHLDQFSFSYDNQLNDSLPRGQFDYGHFLLNIPGGNFDDFMVWADTIRAEIKSFAAKDPESGLSIESMQSKFELNGQGIHLKELDLKTPNSRIADEINLLYADIGALGQFVQEVTLDISLQESVIGKKDIDYFSSIPLNDFQVRVAGRLNGTIPRLSISELMLAFGKGSEITGNFDFMGLPSIDETFIDARVREASIAAGDLAMFNQELASQIKSLKRIDFTGRFLGFVNDFVANGDFKTAIGNVSSDINLKFPTGWDNASYSGSLRLNRFDIGKLINDPAKVGKVNMKGTLDGQGLTIGKAKFYLNASLWQSELLGYQYESIKAKGQFAASFFDGTLNVLDSNCTVLTKGSIDLAHEPEVIKLDTRIKKLHLKELGFSQDTLNIQGHIRADLTSLDFDSLEGNIRVDTLSLGWKGQQVSIDSIIVNSQRMNRKRLIHAILPQFDLKVEGDFYFSQIIRDARLLADEISQYFAPSLEESIPSSHVYSEDYTIDFDLQYGNLNEYLSLLIEEPLYIAPNGEISGTYFQRSNATLTMFTEIDSIFFRGVGYNGNTLDVNLSKDLDSAGIIASIFAYSQQQFWTNNPPTQDLSVEAVWFNDQIAINSHIEQPENNSSADVNGELKISKNKLSFKFLPSRLIAFGEQWFFNPYNRIIYTSRGLEIEGLEIYQNSQSILLKGNYADSTQTNLLLTFHDFDLKTLETLFPEKLGGILDASVEFSRESYNQPLLVNSTLKVVDFELNGLPVGNVTGESQWDTQVNGLRLDFDVKRSGINTIDISGVFRPNEPDENQLNIDARFDQAGLQLFEPFTKGFVINLKGSADGRMKLTGSPGYPILNGSASIQDGRFTFDYLGTTYTVDGGLSFDNNSINLNDFQLSDVKNDQARLSGAITHQGFKNFVLDLELGAREFQFLNTSALDNQLYYGVANGSGNIAIKGSLQDLLIKAQVTTEKGTKLFIPLSSETEVSQKDYISFVDFSDTTSTFNIEEAVKQSISGIRLEFDIDVTPDAYVELIFNIKTGDIIRGRGNGNLNMQLDTNGDFELFGDLSITEGAYNFTIPTLGINKEFNVVPGSTISWYGDPYSGNLDLEATYRQLASFDDYTAMEAGSTQKYPILVVLDLQGDMLSPKIDFEIRLDESLSSPSMTVQSDLSEINNNEQQLKRQVFSLLILRKFSPRDSYLSSGSGSAIGGSVSEFLSNQFSYFISQMDENLEIDVDLTSLDANGFNTFQLRLSYTFLDGRLRVSGGGGLPQNPTDASSTTGSTADYLGDWSLQYLLTPDGHLRLKAFSQTEQNTNRIQRETGVSFQYIKSFDDFKELLTRTRNEALQKKQSSDPQ